MAREPGYCRHKATGQAYVTLGGKVIYLGEYGSEKSKQRYRSLKAEWLTNQAAFEARNQSKRAGTGWPTMAALAISYLEYAEAYYGPTSTEYANRRRACGPILDLYSHRETDLFCTLAFKACRDWWLSDPKRSRGYVNKQIKYLLSILKWGVSARMIPVATFESCRTVAPLKRGRTSAPESKPVLPVDDATVDATLVHATQVVADMVRFQRLTGCRPGELVTIAPGMVDRTGKVWLVRLAKHKTAYRGKSRTIYVGPQAQAILAKYLLRAPDAACFSPIESERQRLATKHAARVTPMSCGNRPGTNRVKHPRKPPGEAFTAGTYARSIRSACLQAKITPWAPNRLRHSAGTAVRKAFGLEAAQVLLGHTELGTTQIYAERDEAKAIEVAMRLG
jgi:integrase